MKAKRKALTAKGGSSRASRMPSPPPVLRAPASMPQASLRALQPRGAASQTAGAAAAAAGAAAAAAEPEWFAGRAVSLTVDLGRDLVLATPILVAAGPFGYGAEVADLVDFDRLGALVTRGTTLKPRAGHAGVRLAEVPAGLLVGVGLPNPGLDAVLERYGETWAGWPLPVILNLCADTAGELGEAVRRLEGAPGVAGIELNLSCGSGRGGVVPGLDPDSTTSWVTAARRETDLPVIAKLTAAAPEIWSIAQAAEDAGADVISAINTLPGFVPARDGTGPALGSGYGGLCGPALKSIALRAVWEIAQSVDIPIVGIGGVTTLDDVLDLLAAGACAVGVGVAAMADPMLPVRLGDELADACRARGVASVADLVGTALPKKRTAPSARGAEYAR